MSKLWHKKKGEKENKYLENTIWVRKKAAGMIGKEANQVLHT